MRAGRLVSLIAIAALLVAGLAVDRRARPHAPSTAAGREVSSLMPTAATTRSLTSAWYCPGATAVTGGIANGTLIIANPTGTPLPATVTLVPVTGAPVGVPLVVQPQSRSVVQESDFLKAQQVAALVDFNGGGGTVEQQVTGANGSAVAPCASQASDNWYFATGSTDRDWGLAMFLFNPFPGDAIVDLSFATDQGSSSPPDFQGVVVPARGLKVLDVGEHVRRRIDVATHVFARAGRVVASQLRVHSAAPKGAILTLGAPSTGPLWVFPDGLAGEGVVEEYHLYNPGPRDAEVSVELALDEGEAEPFDLTVPGDGTYVLVANDEARIPKGVPHTAIVRSTNGVGIVAERRIVAQPPATRTGLASMLGARRPARQWVMGAGTASTTTDEWLVVYNPGTADARFSVTALAAGVPLDVEGVQDVNVGDGRR